MRRWFAAQGQQDVDSNGGAIDGAVAGNGC